MCRSCFFEAYEQTVNHIYINHTILSLQARYVPCIIYHKVRDGEKRGDFQGISVVHQALKRGR